ncbi:MAG: HAD-IA family hydrolase [Anaerolineae bacterium]
MIESVIFDFDGLMADSEPLSVWAWGQVLARHSCQLDDDVLQDVLGLRIIDSAAVFCQHYQLPLTPEEIAAARDEVFLAAVPDRLKALPGLYPLLDALAERGLPLAVATSGHRRYIDRALETLGLSGRFPVIATGDEVTDGKPAPDIFLLAAERLGIDPTACLVLEDSAMGVEAARAAGMACAAVPNYRIPPTEFAAADWIFLSLVAVHESLDDLLAGRLNRVEEVVEYEAAGGVVVRDDEVLVLRRLYPPQVRLPKGHVERDEDVRQAALREVREESGYPDLILVDDLGIQRVEFAVNSRYVVRRERYFLMRLADSAQRSEGGEAQFQPLWLPWDAAIDALTFEAEREWVRRARAYVNRELEAPNR